MRHCGPPVSLLLLPNAAIDASYSLPYFGVCLYRSVSAAKAFSHHAKFSTNCPRAVICSVTSVGFSGSSSCGRPYFMIALTAGVHPALLWSIVLAGLLHLLLCCCSGLSSFHNSFLLKLSMSVVGSSSLLCNLRLRYSDSLPQNATTFFACSSSV